MPTVPGDQPNRPPLQMAVGSRRGGRWRLGAVLTGLAIAVAIGAGVEPTRLTPEPARLAVPAPAPRIFAPSRPGNGPSAGEALPLKTRIDEARRWLGDRPGPVAFAMIGADGRLRGHREHLAFPSASVVKAMLMVAELRRLDSGELPLGRAAADQLRAMITFSDNGAAHDVYARVGDAGLFEVAERAGMDDFDVAVSWGYARISAADMALLFSNLDRVLPARFSEFGKGLLGSVVAEQSWGIPAVADDRWSVRFKGGWRPTGLGELVHQAAELRDGDRRIAIAVLSDGQPSMEAGIETVEGVANRLLPG